MRWVLIIFSSLMLIERINRFLKKQTGQSILKFLATFVIWGIILIISIFPDFAYFISGKLGMGENLNTLIFLGFVVTFMLIFKILSIIENIEQRITEIVREISLKEAAKKK